MLCNPIADDAERAELELLRLENDALRRGLEQLESSVSVCEQRSVITKVRESNSTSQHLLLHQNASER